MVRSGTGHENTTPGGAQLTNKFRCYMLNFGWFIEGEFNTFDLAVKHGKSKGFEFVVYQMNQDSSPGQMLASWSPIGGLRKFNHESGV